MAIKERSGKHASNTLALTRIDVATSYIGHERISIIEGTLLSNLKEYK